MITDRQRTSGNLFTSRHRLEQCVVLLACAAWPGLPSSSSTSSGLAGWLACELPVRARDAVHPHTELVVRLMVKLSTVATVATAATAAAADTV